MHLNAAFRAPARGLVWTRGKIAKRECNNWRLKEREMEGCPEIFGHHENE